MSAESRLIIGGGLLGAGAFVTCCALLGFLPVPHGFVGLLVAVVGVWIVWGGVPDEG